MEKSTRISKAITVLGLSLFLLVTACKPTVMITAPPDGAVFEYGADIDFTCSATDQEDGDLSGASLIWTSDIDGEIGMGTAFTTYTLSAGTHTITVTATDSDGEFNSASVSITVQEKPSNGKITVAITSPGEGDIFEYKTPVTCTGTAVDSQDGTLTGNALVWTSSLDGEIDTGTTFTKSDLSGGTHRITLTATNSRGEWDFSSISITINDRRIWQYQANEEIISSPAIQAGYVYASSVDGTIFSVDAATGKKEWSLAPPSIPIGIAVVGTGTSSPVIVNDNLYIGCYGINLADKSAPGIMLCLDARSGQKLWQFNTSLLIDSSPAVAGGFVYVADLKGIVYCLDADNGNKVWEFKAGDLISSTPAVAEDHVYFGSADRKIYCLDAESGEKQWEFETDKAVNSSPAVSDERVYIGSDDKKLYCLNAEDGNFVWSFTASGRIVSAPAAAGDLVYVGTGDGTVLAINADNGGKVWEFKAGAGISSSPAVADRYLYIGSDDKKLYCLHALTGQKVWEFETGGAVSSSPAVQDGVVCVGSSDASLYCFKADESKAGAWPMFKYNPERTGSPEE